MVIYHATSEENKNFIKENGFKKAYGRFGVGAYFTKIYEECLCYGKVVLNAEIPDNKITWIKYMSLKSRYPDVSFHEEEGITSLGDDLRCQAIGIVYKNGESEICVYDTSIISIA